MSATTAAPHSRGWLSSNWGRVAAVTGLGVMGGLSLATGTAPLLGLTLAGTAATVGAPMLKDAWDATAGVVSAATTAIIPEKPRAFVGGMWDHLTHRNTTDAEQNAGAGPTQFAATPALGNTWALVAFPWIGVPVLAAKGFKAMVSRNSAEVEEEADQGNPALTTDEGPETPETRTAGGPAMVPGGLG